MTPPWLARLQAACDAASQVSVAARLGCSQPTLSLVLRGKYMARTDRVEARVMQLLPEPKDADWLAALRQAGTRTTQAQAADLLGLSEATVSQVLSGTYKAATTRIERRVRGELMGASCDCPVMGSVSTRVCQDVQERDIKKTANPQHAQAWFACRGRGAFSRAGLCPHFNGGGAKPTATLPSTSTQE